VGSLQLYSTALPKRAFAGVTDTTGEHVHDTGVAVRNEHIQAGGALYMCNFGKTGPAGNHSHAVAINGGGDVESRPINVALIYFIYAGKEAEKAEPIATR